MAIFEILQLFSSIVGGVVIILAILAIPQGRAPQQNISITYWASAMLVAIAVITVKILAGLGHAAQQVLIIATISAGLIGLTVASLVAKKPALK